MKKSILKKVAKVIEIVVEHVLILTHAFNYRLVGYILVFPLQLTFCICYYQTPSDYLNIFELAQVLTHEIWWQANVGGAKWVSFTTGVSVYLL